MKVKQIVFNLIILLSYCLCGPNQVLAAQFENTDLVMVIYNEIDNEVAVNLGPVTNVNSLPSGAVLFNAGILSTDMFGANVSSWSDLRVGFFGRGATGAYDAWFATTRESEPGVSTPSLSSFQDTAENLCTIYSIDQDNEYTGTENIFTHKAANSTSYDTKMNSNSTAPGLYAGINPDQQYGESSLGALDTEVGYVDMYLYHYKILTLNTGADPGTPYSCVIRVYSNGSVVLLRPAADVAPTVANPISDVTVSEDASNTVIDLTSVFTDTDNDDTAITKAVLSNSNPGLVTASISVNSLTLEYQANQTGTTEIVIQGTSNGQTVPDTFTVTVTAVDDPPTVANPISNVNVSENASNTVIDLSSIFTDVDNDDDAITKAVLSNSNTGLVTASISGNSLTLVYQENQNGSADIVIRGTSNGFTVDDSFTVSVSSVDDSPTVANPISDVSVSEDAANTLIDLGTVFTDIDNDDAAITKAVLSNSNSGLVTAAISGNTLTLDYQANQSGSAAIVIRGTSNSLTVDDTFIVSVNSVDDSPTVANPISDVSVSEDAANTVIGLATVFTDIDNDDVAITKSVFSNSNSGLVSAAISGNTLTLDYQVNQNGSATIVIRGASNGLTVDDSFTVIVEPVNDVPTISGTPTTAVLQDGVYSFIPTANDVDSGDTLIFSILNRPVWADFNSSTGELSGTPSADDVGTTNGIVISVTDGNSDPVSLPAFNLKVSSSNEAPVISGTPDTSVDEDSPYLFTPTASDPDDDTLIFSIQNRPSWASFNNATGELSGTPENDDVGTTTGIVISVSDSIAEPVSLAAFSITVNNTNDIPVIGGTPLTQVEEDTSYRFIPTGSDDDIADTLTFSIINQPGWAAFNSTTGELSGTPSNSDVGTTSGIVISVTDGNSSPVSLPAFDLEVVNLNDSPTIEGAPATSVNEDSAYSFVPVANDVDSGDTLSFSITNRPAWASFNPSTGALTGTPTNDDVGATTGIVISVTDGNSDPVSLPAFNLEVVNVNDAPVISAIGDRTIIQGGTFSDINLNEYLEDVDNTDAEISWTFTADETNIAFNIDESNILTVSILNQDWVGTVEVSFTAADPDGESDTAIVNFTVDPAPPTVPGINFPADGSEVTDNPPVLSVNNSTSALGSITYDFELASDVGFINAIAADYDCPEGENITSWNLSERFPSLVLDENSNYYWRARANDSNTDSGWMDTATFIMNEYNEEPSTPSVSYPEPGSQVSSLTPALEISNSTDPDNDDLSYRFEVYNFEFNDNSDPGGSPIMTGEVTEESDGTTSYQVTGSLMDNTSYWWRVRAEEKDSDLTSSWAGPYKFTVNRTNNAPTRPDLISPATNGEVNSYNPELTVSNSIDEDIGDIITYIFQIDTVNTFNSTDGGPFDGAEASEGVDGNTSWSPSGLEENMKYYWRVKASDGLAESGWLTSSFTVNVVNEPPQIPVPTYPGDGDTKNTSSLTLKANSATDPDIDTVKYIFEICKAGGDCTTYEDLAKPELKITGLSNNSEYEWAVKAVDEHGAESGWSSQYSFTVITNYVPNPPRLNNPGSGGSVFVDDPIILSIKNSTDDDGDDLTYYFEIYSDSQLTNLVETGSAAEGNIITEYNVASELIADTTYYWRAYATDGENDSSYSSTFSFIASSEEPAYTVDVVESQVIYSSMLKALEDDEYYDISVNDVTSKLNGVTISIPNGAVDSDINITIGEANATPALPAGVVVTGRIINFGPEGTVFNNPVIIKIPYTQDDLTAMGTDDPLELRLYTYSSSSTGWEILEPESADTASSMLLFEVSHFSIFTFGVETVDTGTPGGDSTGGSSEGGGCFIATASDRTMVGWSFWALLAISVFVLLGIRKQKLGKSKK